MGGQYHQQNRVYTMGDVCLANTASIPGGSYLYIEVKKMQIGNFLKTKNRENPNQGRVYESDGMCPTLSGMQGGGQRTAYCRD